MSDVSPPNVLLNTMTASFDMNELRQLCFALGLDDEELPNSDTKTSLAIALIKQARRRQMFEKLIAECERQRPRIAWKQLTTALPENIDAPEETKSQFHLSTGNITNSQITIAGNDVTIQQANVKTDKATGEKEWAESWVFQ